MYICIQGRAVLLRTNKPANDQKRRAEQWDPLDYAGGVANLGMWLGARRGPFLDPRLGTGGFKRTPNSEPSPLQLATHF